MKTLPDLQLIFLQTLILPQITNINVETKVIIKSIAKQTKIQEDIQHILTITVRQIIQMKKNQQYLPQEVQYCLRKFSISKRFVHDTVHSVHPPLFLFEGGGGGVAAVNLLPIFQKKGGGLDRNSVFRGGLLRKRGQLFSGGAIFRKKTKIWNV